MEKLVDRASSGVRHVWDGYIALVGTHDENQRLKRENDELRMQITRDHERVLEGDRVRALAGLADTALGKMVVARVIGRDPARSQTVTIDKGTAHGVKSDSAVITAAGIVGRVIHAGNFSSIVQLIVDSQSAVGVMVESTRRQGIVRGTGGRDLDLDYIDDDMSSRWAMHFELRGRSHLPERLSRRCHCLDWAAARTAENGANSAKRGFGPARRSAVRYGPSRTC
jgi:rod shape-determining protein MreC